MTSTTTKTLSGIAAVAVAGVTVVGLAAPASAHHPIVSGEAVCNEDTGKFDVTWSIGNSEDDKVMTFTTDRPSVDGGTVEEGGTVTRTEEVEAGTHRLVVDATWPKNGVTDTRDAEVEATGACEKPSPSPSPSEPEATETTEPTETPETTAPTDDETTSVPPATGPATTGPPTEEPVTDEPTEAGPASADGPAGDGAGPTDGVPTRIPAGGDGADELEAASADSGVVGQPVVLGLISLGAGLAAIGGLLGTLRVRARQD
jgi:hypothetical protein